MADFIDILSEAGSLGRVDIEKIRATTQQDIAAQMREDGEDPDAPFAHHRRREAGPVRSEAVSDAAAPSSKRARRRRRARHRLMAGETGRRLP